jgi:3-phenylpropionate/trans-cinnamate dioxygenase ferredoxin reductase component
VKINRIVIVGTGQAGYQTAASLRTEGFEGEIVMLGDEPGLPYQRPPLSKTFFKDGNRDRMLFREQAFFDKNRIEIRDNTRISAIDRAAKTVSLAGGGEISYGHLILATGTRNRPLPVPGTDLNNVVALRTLEEADTIRGLASPGLAVIMIGGGFIGLEAASVLADVGCQVTVLEAAPRLMARAVSEPVSAHFHQLHEAAGIKIHYGVGVGEITGNATGDATGVKLADGSDIAANLVFVSVGVLPNTELAAEAGLEVENGILVDEVLATSDPSISAIGDCASFVHKRSGRQVRLESVQNAVDQAKCVAARIAGKAAHYDAVAWFWSDQGGAKLQIAGLTDHGDTRIVRRSDDEAKLSVFSFKGDEFLGVETVNMPTDFMATRKLLEVGHSIKRHELEASDFRLKDMLVALRKGGK